MYHYYVPKGGLTWCVQATGLPMAHGKRPSIDGCLLLKGPPFMLCFRGGLAPGCGHSCDDGRNSSGHLNAPVPSLAGLSPLCIQFPEASSSFPSLADGLWARLPMESSTSQWLLSCRLEMQVPCMSEQRPSVVPKSPAFFCSLGTKISLACLASRQPDISVRTLATWPSEAQGRTF